MGPAFDSSWYTSRDRPNLCNWSTRSARRSRKSGCPSPVRRHRLRAETPYRDGTTHVIFEPIDFIAGSADSSRPGAASEPQPLPRRIRTQSPCCARITPTVRGARRQGHQAGTDTRPHAGRAMSNDSMRATPQVGLSSRRRNVSGLRRRR